MRNDPLTVYAEVLSERGPILRCRVAGSVLDIARTHVGAGSEVAHVGDCGRLIVPRWIGVISGVMAPQGRSYGRG